MNTKKILLYSGGAIVLGAVAFFVWSFFQKVEIPIGNTVIGLGTQPDEAPVGSNPSGTPNNATPPFVADNSNSDIPAPFDPNVNNPFQPLDDQAYSDLDAFIHRGK
jgi:hypothetical protein